MATRGVRKVTASTLRSGKRSDVRRSIATTGTGWSGGASKAMERARLRDGSVRIVNLLINSLARRITHRLQVSYSESTGFRSVGAWIAPDPKASSPGASKKAGGSHASGSRASGYSLLR